MKIILKETVSDLGERGEIKDVSDGYARNFLIPKGLAVRLTKMTQKEIEEEKKKIELLSQREKRKAEEIAKRLDGLSLTIKKRAGQDDRLFGSVSVRDIISGLKEEGIEIEKKNIVLDKPIRAIGIYTIPIKLHKEVEGSLKIWVVKDTKEEET
jgi:large subunit ribosomal protein L9